MYWYGWLATSALGATAVSLLSWPLVRRWPAQLWLGWIDAVGAGHPDGGFVMLHCVGPSQSREWPAHVRFARQHGLTLQDAICVAQVADGYLGVLDIFGLAAHSAGRPGVYVPLEDAELPRAESSPQISSDRQIMVGSRDRTRRLASIPEARKRAGHSLDRRGSALHAGGPA